MIKPNEVGAAVILAILGQLPAKELSLKTLGQDPRLEPFSYAVLQATAQAMATLGVLEWRLGGQGSIYGIKRRDS